MTARSSPQHAATVRAQVRRRAINRVRPPKPLRYDWTYFNEQPARDDPGLAFRIAEGRAAAAKYLRDEPKTEEQKASRWRRIWGARD